MTDFFFSMPGFFRGAARVLDMGSWLHKGSYLISDSPAEADARALASDWAAIDGDHAVAASQIARDGQKEKDAAR
jgi:hypothetical protein